MSVLWRPTTIVHVARSAAITTRCAAWWTTTLVAFFCVLTFWALIRSIVAHATHIHRRMQARAINICPCAEDSWADYHHLRRDTPSSAFASQLVALGLCVGSLALETLGPLGTRFACEIVSGRHDSGIGGYSAQREPCPMAVPHPTKIRAPRAPVEHKLQIDADLVFHSSAALSRVVTSARSRFWFLLQHHLPRASGAPTHCICDELCLDHSIFQL